MTISTSPTSSGSSAEVTSSNSITCGSIISARAIATRCCCPPESWCGCWPAFSERPTRASSSRARASASARGWLPDPARGERQVVHHGQVREEVELLEDHPDPRGAPRETSTPLRVISSPSKKIRPALERLEQVDAAQERALAAAARADDRQHLAARDAEVDALRGPRCRRSSCARPRAGRPAAASRRARRSRTAPRRRSHATAYTHLAERGIERELASSPKRGRSQSRKAAMIHAGAADTRGARQLDTTWTNPPAPPPRPAHRACGWFRALSRPAPTRLRTPTAGSRTSSTTCSRSRASTRCSCGSPTRSTRSSRTRRCTSTRRTSRSASSSPALVRSEYADEILSERFPFGEGITGWAVEHREPVLANQAHLDPRVRFVPGTPARAGGADRRPARRARRAEGHAQRLPDRRATPPSARRSSSSPSASATRPRSRSTTRTSARGSSARRRPTRSPASTTTATSTSASAAS